MLTEGRLRGMAGKAARKRPYGRLYNAGGIFQSLCLRARSPGIQMCLPSRLEPVNDRKGTPQSG